MYDFNKSLRFSFANDFDAINFFFHTFSLILEAFHYRKC